MALKTRDIISNHKALVELVATFHRHFLSLAPFAFNLPTILLSLIFAFTLFELLSPTLLPANMRSASQVPLYFSHQPEYH